MGNVDPRLMGKFRRSIKNPACFRRVYSICRSYSREDLRCREGAYNMIDRLSECCNVSVTCEEREHAADYLTQCGMDPQNRNHRRRCWHMVRGGGGGGWWW